MVKKRGILKKNSFDFEVEFSFEIWSKDFLTLLGEIGNFEESDTSHKSRKVKNREKIGTIGLN